MKKILATGLTAAVFLSPAAVAQSIGKKPPYAKDPCTYQALTQHCKAPESWRDQTDEQQQCIAHALDNAPKSCDEDISGSTRYHIKNTMHLSSSIGNKDSAVVAENYPVQRQLKGNLQTADVREGNKEKKGEGEGGDEEGDGKTLIASNSSVAIELARIGCASITELKALQKKLKQKARNNPSPKGIKQLNTVNKILDQNKSCTPSPSDEKATIIV